MKKNNIPIKNLTTTLKARNFIIHEFQKTSFANRSLRVALVNPPDPSSFGNSRITPPLGLGYIASFARDCGHHVDIFDLTLDLNPSIEMLRNIGFFDAYDIYGLSSYTDNFTAAQNLASVIRIEIKKVKIVFGGYHVSILDQETLRDYEQIDLIVRGEGELTFSRILEHIARDSNEFSDIPSVTWRNREGIIIKNLSNTQLADQNLLPFPARDIKYGPNKYIDFLDWKTGEEKPALSMVSSRGCPKRCTFCSITVLDPLWRARTVGSMMKEIEQCYEESPFEHIFFEDANFFVRPSRSIEFSRALWAFNPRITWSGTSTPDHIVKHADVIEELGRLNCSYLEVGIESGNENSLKRFGKGNTVKTNISTINILERSRIKLALDFIMFEPEMTIQDIRDNLKFIHDCDFDAEWPSNLFQELLMYPGTVARTHYLEKRGEIIDDHLVPETKFFDSTVQNIFDTISIFRLQHQGNIDNIIRTLYSSLRGIQYAPWCHNNDTLNDYQNGCRSIIELRHLPFNFVLSVVNQHSKKSSIQSTEYNFDLAFNLHGSKALIRAKIILKNLQKVIENNDINIIDKFEPTRTF